MSAQPRPAPLLVQAAFGSSAAYAAYQLGVPGEWTPLQDKAAFYGCAAFSALIAGRVLLQAKIGVVEAWKREKRRKGTGAKARSRFMSGRDVRRAGMHRPSGQPLGMFEGRVVWGESETSTLVVSPAGSGKSAAIYFPKLLEDRRNHIVSDLKPELHGTAEHRARRFGHEIHELRFDGTGARFNPLLLLQTLLKEDNRRTLVLSSTISLHLLPEPEKAGENGFFRQGGRDDLETVMLAVAETMAPHNCTLTKVWTLFRDEDALCKVLHQASVSERLSGQVAARAEALLKAIEDEDALRKLYDQFRAGVLQALKPFGPGDILEEVVSESTFEASLFARRPNSVTLFIMSAPEVAEHVKSWVGLIYEVVLFETMRLGKKIPLELAMDEFTQNPVPSLVKIIALLRDHKIRGTYASQSISEVKRVYSEPVFKYLTSEGSVSVFLAARGDDARYVSERLGKMERLSENWSDDAGFWKRATSFEASEVMSPQEVEQMPVGKALLFYKNAGFVMLDKLAWFEVKRWRRAMPRLVRAGRRDGSKALFIGRLGFGPAALRPRLGWLWKVLDFTGFALWRARLVLPIAAAAATIWTLETHGAPHVLIDPRECAYAGPTSLQAQVFRGGGCPFIRLERSW